MPITLQRQSAIPHDPNLTLRMRRLPAAEAPGPTPPTPAPSPSTDSDLFFLAKMDGEGDLSTYTPDIGSAPTSAEVNFDDSFYSTLGAVVPLTDFALDGAGGVLYGGLLYQIVAFKLPAPEQPDYFLEAEVEMDPATVTFGMLLAMRCGAVSEPDKFLSFVGALFENYSLPTYHASVMDGDGSGGSGNHDLGDLTLDAGVQTVKFRAEVVGSIMVVRLNRIIIGTYDFTNALYDPAGDAYFVFNFSDDGIPGGVFQAPILKLRAGYL